MPGPEEAPIEMEIDAIDEHQGESSGITEVKRREKRERGGEKGKADGKHKDCFALADGGGGDGGRGGSGGNSSSSSSSNTGSSSSESEVEQQERQRQIDQWNLKRPGIMEAHLEVAKRQRHT